MSSAPRSDLEPPTSSPSARSLESTRAALRKFVERDSARGATRSSPATNTDVPMEHSGERHEPSSVIRVVGAAVEAWWEQNPLAVLPKIAKPLVEEQVRRYPWQALGLSAAAGAAFVLLKPWRRLPTANLASALLRTTSVSAVAAAALAAVQESMNAQDDRPPG